MTTQTHGEELKEFYDRLPIAYPREKLGDAKLISYDLLVAIIDKMMNKAFYHGQIQALNGVEDLLDRSFKK